MESAGRSLQPTWLVPVVVSDQPLRPPDALSAALRSARVARGWSPQGPDHPRRRWWLLGVLPATTADLLAVAGWGATGSVVAGIAAAGMSAVTAGIIVLVQRDPLRITRRSRRQLDRSLVWQSSNAWLPPLTDSPERAQLARVQQSVYRMVNTAHWWDELATQARGGLDLVAELDEVDGQAFRLATLGAEGQSRTQLQGLLEQRVQAMVALADELELQDARSVAAVPSGVEPSGGEPTGETVAGGVLDEYATQRLLALTRAVRESAQP